MQLLDEHLWNLYIEGKINPADAIDRSRSPGQMQDKIDTHRRGLEAAATAAPAKEDEEAPVDVAEIDTIRTT